MEIWDLYDINRNIVSHNHIRGNDIPDGYFHLVVHVWLRNNEGKYLISKRSENKEIYPNLYDCVGGSVIAGETSEDGAIRETIEEVGIKLKKGLGKIVYTEVRNREKFRDWQDVLDVWVYDYSGSFDLKNATTDEVSSADWKTIYEIKQIYEDGLLMPTLKYIFDLDKKLQNIKTGNKKTVKNKKKVKKLSENTRYFDFYDDVKAGCHKIVDW